MPDFALQRFIYPALFTAIIGGLWAYAERRRELSDYENSITTLGHPLHWTATDGDESPVSTSPQTQPAMQVSDSNDPR